MTNLETSVGNLPVTESEKSNAFVFERSKRRNKTTINALNVKELSDLEQPGSIR